MFVGTLSTVAPLQPSTSWAHNVGELVQIHGLEYNRAETMDECIEALERNSLPTFPDPSRFLKRLCYTRDMSSRPVYQAEH